MRTDPAAFPTAWRRQKRCACLPFWAGALITATFLAHADPEPANDQFANALPAVDGALVSNLGATKEPGEPNITKNSGGKSIWWKWSAPADGVLTLTTAGSDFDTLLGVFTGSEVSALSRIAFNDDANGISPASGLSFQCTAGMTYSIVVDGFNGSSGHVMLHLNYSSAEPVDDTEPELTLPIVTVTTPAADMVVSGTINLSAATVEPESRAVSAVEFYRDDGTLLAASARTPYSVRFDTKSLANGRHTFYAKAYDPAGNWSTSNGVSVTVANSSTAPVHIQPVPHPLPAPVLAWERLIEDQNNTAFYSH